MDQPALGTPRVKRREYINCFANVPGAIPRDFRRAREGSQAALQDHEVAWTTISMLLRIHQTPQTHFKAQNAIFRQKLMLVMVELVGHKAGRALGWQHLGPRVMPPPRGPPAPTPGSSTAPSHTLL